MKYNFTLFEDKQDVLLLDFNLNYHTLKTLRESKSLSIERV